MNYKLFGHSGLRVSELCMGTMTFGEEWGTGADKNTSKKIFDRYVGAGGNFFDTANRYTEGTSEKFLGEFIKQDRERFVVATKYSLHDREGDLNFCGNSRRNLMRSVEQSLKRLDTDYIDLLWLHMWDFTASPEEVMRGLNDLIEQGKVHYTGISDTPAWVVSRCNTLAELRGWNRFAGMQIEYSLIERSGDRDLLPAAEFFDLAVTPWSPLGAGMLTGKYLDSLEGRLSEKSVKMNDRNLNIARKVKEVAEDIGASPSQVALRWLMNRSDRVIPILGARTEEQIKDNLGVLNMELGADHDRKLDEISKIDLGFPHEFLEREATNKHLFAGVKDRLKF